jgi:mannose-6-phosphate isomerase-like protein (cupin superfamily)
MQKSKQYFKPQHEQCMVFTNLITMLVPGQQTGGCYSVFEDHTPPLAGPPPHSHPDEEIFYVLEGSYEFVLGDVTQPFRVKPGEVVRVPANVLHCFKNMGTTVGRLLTIISPGNLEAYFREIAAPVKCAEDIPDLQQVPDLAKVDIEKAFALAPRHDVIFYLPQVVG